VAGTWSRLERAYPNISYSLGIAVLGPCALVPAASGRAIIDESDFVIIGRDVPPIRREKGAQSVFDLPGHLIANDRLISL
jgi:hypothetical protein